MRTYTDLIPKSIFPKADPATDANFTHSEEDQRVALGGWPRRLDVSAGVHVVRMRPRGLWAGAGVVTGGEQAAAEGGSHAPLSPPRARAGLPRVQEI